MNLDPELAATHSYERAVETQPLRIRNWLWRPWYAKAWWIAAIIFWSFGFLLTEFWHLGPLEDSDWPYLLMLLFHPYLIVPVLGFGYVRALFNRAWAEVDEEDEIETGLYDGTGEVGFHRPSGDRMFRRKSVMDPTNLSAIWNPANPISPAWRDDHLWRKH